MKYTVAWRPQAEQQLAALWLNAADRPRVAAAADAIDMLLAKDPQECGESRSGPTRILFVRLSVVLFEISEPDRIVYVTTVART